MIQKNHFFLRMFDWENSKPPFSSSQSLLATLERRLIHKPAHVLSLTYELLQCSFDVRTFMVGR